MYVYFTSCCCVYNHKLHLCTVRHNDVCSLTHCNTEYCSVTVSVSVKVKLV